MSSISKKTRNLHEFRTRHLSFDDDKKPVKVSSESSFTIQKHSTPKNQIESIAHPTDGKNFMIKHIKNKIELQDINAKYFENNVLQQKKKKEGEIDDFIKKGIVSFEEKKTKEIQYSVERSKQEKKNYKDSLFNQLKERRLLLSVGNRKIQKKESIELENKSVVKQQEKEIKKYYKECLLTQMIQKLETDTDKFANMRIIKLKNLKKINDLKEKLLPIN